MCRPKAQPVQTETGGKRPAEKFGAGFIIQTLELGKWNEAISNSRENTKVYRIYKCSTLHGSAADNSKIIRMN